MRRQKMWWLGSGIVAAALIGAACTGSGAAESRTDSVRAERPDGGGFEAVDDVETGRDAVADGSEEPESVVSAEATQTTTGGLSPATLYLAASATETPSGDLIFREPLGLNTGSWQTNFDVRLIDITEIVSVLPRDAIRSLDEPNFESVAAGDEWLTDNHPVIRVAINDDVRAFPLGIMTSHEIANTTIGGQALAVTFCPLCNSAIAFDRTLLGEVVEFGTSGMLRKSDLVMWDRTTETLWQQLTGRAIIGGMVGATLTQVPAPVISWEQFKASDPGGLVLALDQGLGRRYEINGYPAYDSGGPYSSFFTEATDPRLHPTARVAAIDLDGERVAYDFELLARVRVVDDEIAGTSITVLWTPGTASALDTQLIDSARDVGATGVFSRSLNGSLVTLQPNPNDDQTFIDAETGSVWSVLGKAISGELAGSQLSPITHGSHFWFAWAAFFPDTELVQS
jgi:hypothetical protein